MTIIPNYAALLAILFLILTFRTIFLRVKFRVSLGDGGQPQLIRAMRVHANFIEYVPLSLILVSFAELKGASSMMVHCLGAALLLGRTLHAYGVSQVKEKLYFRQVGMVLTLGTIITSLIFILIKSF